MKRAIGVGITLLTVTYIAVVYVYARGYSNGYTDGHLEGERSALRDMGLSESTILSQTT